MRLSGLSLKQRGFTLIEMLTVMVITGILAAFAISRFSDTTTFESRGFFDQAQAVIRNAQQLAIAQRAGTPGHPPVFVVIAANGVRICYDAGCATPVVDVGGTPLQALAPNGVTLAPAAVFSYTALGTPSLGANLVINVTGGTARTFQIAAQTGYVFY